MNRLTKIIPHLSEKASAISSSGKYVFLVPKNADKEDIKSTIQSLFKVEVRSINTVNLPDKSRFFRRVKGKVSRMKKAIVSLKKGTISIFE